MPCEGNNLTLTISGFMPIGGQIEELKTRLSAPSFHRGLLWSQKSGRLGEEDQKATSKSKLAPNFPDLAGSRSRAHAPSVALGGICSQIPEILDGV